MAGTPSGGTAAAIGGGDDPAALLQAEASRDPQPVARWLQAMAITGNQLRGGGASDQAKKAFNAPGGPASLCKQAVAGRYPFTPGSQNDIPLDDFARLFASGGLLDKYFTDNLASFVDTSGPVWKAQAVAGVAPPVTPGDLAQFQRASQIRDLFFAGGGNQPTVRFDITPIDTDAKQVTMDLDGLSVVYAHGPLRATSVTWPGPNRMNSARLVFDPPPSSGPPVLQATGPWALFRLFGMGSLTQNGCADDYTLSFTLGDRHATFEIRAGSVLNPVRARCAARLQVSGVVAGFYGKLPARGDFVRAGLPRDFTDPWDDWLQSVIAGSRALVGDGVAAGLSGIADLALRLAARHVRRSGGARPDAAERGQGGPLFSAQLRGAASRRHCRRGRAMPGSMCARPLDARHWNRIRNRKRSRL